MFTPDDLIDLYRIYRDRQVMKYVGIGARTLAETEAVLYDRPLAATWFRHVGRG
ncbi:MAG: hypothetical protein GDA43_15600 [Hormoscilla sp. SP5CHS1]|nr:hypothetical protein [Hormoscilla sp. SP12CHS1]MBC6454440.1 hypothetical protein [Hormoscilla sp. SP5CHS1]MBC6472903.1 hypothetical protein [Hormoscilla sp. GM102CHS1]